MKKEKDTGLSFQCPSTVESDALGQILAPISPTVGLWRTPCFSHVENEELAATAGSQSASFSEQGLLYPPEIKFIDSVTGMYQNS